VSRSGSLLLPGGGDSDKPSDARELRGGSSVAADAAAAAALCGGGGGGDGGDWDKPSDSLRRIFAGIESGG